MFKQIKKNQIQILSILLIVFVVYLFQYNKTSIDNKQEVVRIKAEEIETGMSVFEVLYIMNRSHVNCEGTREYCLNTLRYNTYDDSFPYIEIKFNENQKVNNVYIPNILYY